ncbi:MAG: hypothetical protein JXJ17_04810 [Anaerolineae bacterium]|nr:hypothetical protein [Anaerolineae bacterium]
MSGNDEKPDELISKECFSSYLVSKYGEDNVVIPECLNEEDPPDYIFIINGEKCAVEVTSIRDSEWVVYQHAQCVKRIKQEAISQNILYGTYSIAFNEQVPHISRKNVQESLVEDALDYIRRTQQCKEHDEYTLREIEIKKLHYTKPICTIVKTGVERDSIGWIGLTEVACLSGTAKRLLEKAIGAKIQYAQSETMPVYLLIYNRFNWGIDQDFRDCELDTELCAPFEGIFVVKDEQNGYMKYTRRGSAAHD